MKNLIYQAPATSADDTSIEVFTTNEDNVEVRIELPVVMNMSFALRFPTPTNSEETIAITTKCEAVYQTMTDTDEDLFLEGVIDTLENLRD